MAVTIADLIAKKDEIKAKKSECFALDTSVGDIIVKLPSLKIMADVWDMRNLAESNQLLILECVIQPNLKDKELQDAYGCFEPLDIVSAIFETGEISRIAGTILDKAGFNRSIKSKLYKEIKN